jgi:Protein kinase domain/AAA ATPase domain
MIDAMGRVSTAGRPSGDRYEVLEQLAAGGMGVIHRAYDRLARREVAYKRLVVTNEDARARLTLLFQREYDTLAHLAHPNIVETFDYGQELDGPYYTMELLTGSDLTRVAPKPYREACRILRDVASALALVHARRLIHRDVSPANIRLTGDGRAKLIDFGALTPFGKPDELVGTASCMAPECLSDSALDQRADLYSLGAVAYWLLTHKTSVRARQIKELPEAWNEPIAAPSLFVPEIPKELDALVLSLLSREPLSRPANAAYVIDQLTTIGELAPQADEQRVAYSYLAHPPLSGRSEALRTLESALVEAAAGHGNVALVEANAGLGRTALLDSLALSAQLDGFVVLRARGDRRAGPFGLARKLTDFAYTLYHDLSPGQSKGQSFLTYQSGQKAQSAADVAAHHAQIVSSVTKALFALSQRSPVAIVIDDLHASDPESLSLLASLLQELGAHRLALVAGTLSAGDLDESPGHALIKAGAKRLTLSPLGQEEVVELVQSVFGGVPNSRRVAQWLHAESGGNPATCMDLARLLLTRGVIRYTLGTFTLPHTLETSVTSDDLSAAILARLGNIGPHAYQVACALCLHEGALTPEQLATALALSPREVLLALEELSSRSVVTQQDDSFSFTASSLRATLTGKLAPEAKQALHVELASALLAHGHGLMEASFQASTHLLQGGRETEAAELVANLGRGGLNGESAARWVVLIEAVLAVFARQKRSKEQHLALLIPLMHAGFYGELAAQRRHIENAVQWMSAVCGMTLARRLRPYLGGKLSLLAGILYAAVRRGFTPKAQRLGSLPEMLAEFVGLVSAGTAAAVSADDTASAQRWNASLEPFSALPADTSGYLLREFCLATVEVGLGEFSVSAARYARLMPALLKPIAGLDDALRLTIYRGCLNGRAQAEMQEYGSHTLALAEELGHGDPFFAPHAECVRMGYYSYRGERDKAEHHRAQAELFALRGGNSWSAETIVAKRLTITSIMTRDAIGLVQAIAAVERLANIAPNMVRYRIFCEAWLECLRGRPEQGVALYERFIDAEGARLFYTWRFDRAQYAALLNAAGQHARAKAVCAELLRDQKDLSDLRDLLHFSLQQLALAEAGLGQHREAARLMDMLLTNARRLDNPLLLGDAHRDRAYIALRDGDSACFEEHFAAMQNSYLATRNPSLIQQCDKLAALAVESGVRSAVLPFREGLSEIGSTTALISAELSGIRKASASTPVQQDERGAHS